MLIIVVTCFIWKLNWFVMRGAAIKSSSVSVFVSFVYFLGNYDVEREILTLTFLSQVLSCFFLSLKEKGPDFNVRDKFVN